jgi:hypothetical protein
MSLAIVALPAMARRDSLFKSLIAAIVLAFFLLPSLSLAGFGVSPAGIDEDRLVKGSVFERVIYFVQGTPDKDLNVIIEVDDTEIKDWITTIPSGRVVIPKGTQQFPVTVRVTVPKDARLGIYKGYVRATGAPAVEVDPETGAAVSTGVTIALGARAELNLAVGEGIHYEYAIRNVDLKNVKETEFPKAFINIENIGNVPAGPVAATFELYNKYGDVRLAYVQGISIKPVEPFKASTVEVEFPISVGLSVGEYWGHVKLYNEKGEQVREFKDIFNVTEATFWDRHGKQIGMGVGALLVIIVLWYFLSRRSKRRRAS